MKSEHNLSIEQLQLIKLIESINQKYRQRCNIDKNKVLSDTNLRMLKSILPGLIILYKWNQEKKESAINLEELIDRQLTKYRRLQNILNKKINNKTPTDKTNYLYKKDKNLIRLEYLAKIIKFISQEKTIQKKIRDLKVSENDCMLILDKLNKLSNKIKKTASKEKLQTSKYISAILHKYKSLEKSDINYLEDIQIENSTKNKSSDRIVREQNPTIITNALHTIQNINKEEQEKAINDCKTHLRNQEKQFSLERNNNHSETLLMFENKNKILNYSSDESCDLGTSSSIDNNQPTYSSSLFITCNENEDTNNRLITSATSNIYKKDTDNTDNYAKIQNRKELINDCSYILSVHNDSNVTSQSQIECNCSECQEGNWMRLRGGKTKENICFCPQCFCQNCVGKDGREKSCDCGERCKCDPCGDTHELDEILAHRIENTKITKDTQPIFTPCSCPKDACPCNPCNDPQRAKAKCKCDCSVDGCKCNPCKCTPCNDPTCNLKKFQCFCLECYCNPCTDPSRKKVRSICDIAQQKPPPQCVCSKCTCNPCSDPQKNQRSVCDDITCENTPPFPALCACPNCECSPCSDPSCQKSKPKCDDLRSIISTCKCIPNACKCNPCKCDPCNDPNCNKPINKKSLNKCGCPPGDACKCDPCSDPVRNKPTKCFCPEGSCPCDPCADPTRYKKLNKCFCPERSCPCDPCADPIRRAKLNKCFCPEETCPCENCTDTTRIKKNFKKCNCPEDNCHCNACQDPKRAKKQHICACPIDGYPCKTCKDSTRVKPKPCNCPDNACFCDSCADPTRAKAKSDKKCNCPENSCLCKSCGDLERVQQMRARAAQVTQAQQNTECYCPEDTCLCEKCADPARSKPKPCSCPEDSCPCEKCQDSTRNKTKKCLCPEAYCPCEICDDLERAEKNKRERSMKNNNICGCPEDACLCEACADPTHVKHKKCSCPQESCNCENCGDPDRVTKKCMCPQDFCLCEDCGDPSRKKKTCNCPEEYCPCEECGDKDRATRNKQNHACSCGEDTCLCNPCSDPTRARRNTCSCPKDACSCENCGDITRRKKKDECICPIEGCPCDPCKDATRKKKQEKCGCEPNACACNKCSDPTVTKAYKCSCMGECTCNPCNDPAIQAKSLRNELKQCDCIGECNCKPCEDPKFKKEKYCTCKSCTCIQCSDPKYQKNKFCSCQPQCECKYCSLPRKTLAHSVASLYKSAVSIVCERLSTYVDKTRSTNDSCRINSAKSQEKYDKEVCVIYQPNRHPGCTCAKCLCDPCSLTIPEPPPPPTEMLCVCDVQSNTTRKTIPDDNKVLPLDCTCDKCACDPCIPPPKQQSGVDACTCPRPCKCCGICNKLNKERSQLTAPPPPSTPLKTEICSVEGCTCTDQCCCEPCQPKPKNMNKCKCIGTCKCNACAKKKKQIPEDCTCDNCECNPCKPQVKDETKCVCGKDTCDCDACFNLSTNQQSRFKTSTSANASPPNIMNQQGTNERNANKHNEECTCPSPCNCEAFQRKQQATCDTTIPCECYQCKCEKRHGGKNEFCCICDDQNIACDFKCTCGEHCPCETQMSVPVKETKATSDCTCDPCTCDPCFTKESQMEKISRINTDPSKITRNDSSLPCSCQPVCRCGDNFNENVTQVHSYSDKDKNKQKQNDCDLAQNTMIIKADEIQINEVCNCCKCPDKNNKTRDQQTTAEIMKDENNKKRFEKLQENEQKIEKQVQQQMEEEQKQRFVAIIKGVCEKTQQNNEKQQQRVIAVINSSCQKNQQKIEIKKEQQRVVAVINSKCHKPIQSIEKQQSQKIEEKSTVFRPSICENQKQKLVEVMSTCLNEEVQLEQYKMQQKQNNVVIPQKPTTKDHFKEEKIDTVKEKIDLGKEKFDPCREQDKNPCWKERKESCRKERIDPSQKPTTPPCLEEQTNYSREERRIEPYQIVYEQEESCYSCDNEGYSSLKADVCVKLKSKFQCIKAYFGDYFSELIKSRAIANDDDDECTCDICKCRREIRIKRHKSTITQDCACSSACKDVACSILSNESKKRPCCVANVPKSEQCITIINSKKTLSICPSRKAISYSETCSTVQKEDCNTNTRGLGANYLDEYYYSENIQKDIGSVDSHDKNLIWSRPSSKDKNVSFIELYDYKQNNKGLQAMVDDDDYYDNDNHEIVSQTYSPFYNLERKYNQQLRINDTEDTSKSGNPMEKYTHQQIYCIDIKNEKQNLKTKINQCNKINNSYLFKNVKSLHSSISDLDGNEWEYKNNSKFDKIIRTNNNLLTTDEYKFCKNKSINAVELQIEHESSYTTAIKSNESQYSSDGNNWYFINMQGVVPLSDNMEYKSIPMSDNNMDDKYKYGEQYGQPIMVTLSGQLSAKLSESINNSYNSKDAYERFVSDSKRLGINIPFISRKSIQSYYKDLTSNNSSHIPQREYEDLRKAPKDIKNTTTDNTYRQDYTQHGSIRKRGGAIPKDNIKGNRSRKIDFKPRSSSKDERENSRDKQQKDNFFRQQYETILDKKFVNKEEKMALDFIPKFKSGGSICISDDHDGPVEPEQSSYDGSSLSFNDRIYDHDKRMNEDYQNNNDNELEKIIDELYLNKAKNNSSKIIDTKTDLIETVSFNTNKVSFCSAISNAPHRSMSLGGINSVNSTEYNRSEHNYHFARGGGYNPKTDKMEFNDLDGERRLLQAYSGIIRKTISEIPKTDVLSENKFYSISNLTSIPPVRKASPIYIDDYSVTNRTTGLKATVSNAEIISDHAGYTNSFDSVHSYESKENEKRECVAMKFHEDQNLPVDNCDEIEKKEEQYQAKHDEECTCRVCVCGDCNCKICECEKGAEEEYENLKKQKEEAEERAKYCTCYVCECNECNCTKCECDIDKFPEGIPLSKIVCPCTNCDCGIDCKDGTLLKSNKFFMTRDNDLFKIPDNLDQDVKIKMLNAVQNVNVDIKLAIKNANLEVAEAMQVADKMVQNAVLQLCKMDIEIKDVKNAFQNPLGLSTTSPDLSNNEIELLTASDNEKLKDTIVNANQNIINAVGNATLNVTDAIWTANRNFETAMSLLLSGAVPEEKASFTEAKGAIDDSEGSKDNQQSSDNQKSSDKQPPTNQPSNFSERRKKSIKKGDCDCPYPCKCDDCPDQPHEPPPCDCPEPCECVGCPTLNIPVKDPHCRCKTCLCNPCADKKRKRGLPIEKFLCGCKPECICEKCPAKPGCECEGECVCPVCPHKERKCDCVICLCKDCAALKQVQQLCDCPQCLCNVCEKGGGIIPTKPPKLIYNVKCKCAVCLCDNCTSDKIKKTCSCPICLCDKCPEMEDKQAYECSCYPQCTCDKCADPNVKCITKRQKEEPYKCTCAICYCEKCSDPTKKRQDPCPEEHPKDCTCLKCTCSPCLSKKQKISECKCEKCKCDPCKMVGGMLPDCKCSGKCECMECVHKTVNIDECTCKICECNKNILCIAGVADGNEIKNIENSECTCDPCNCNPCLAHNGHKPNCKCPKCMCTKCDIKPLPTCDEGVHPPGCKCNICYCAPCKYDTDPNCDQTFRVKCTCEVCSCKPCKAKGDSCDEDNKKGTTPESCLCRKCECSPCILPRNKFKVNVTENLPTCLCGNCTCNPCMAVPLDICNEPREPPKYTPDCSCPKCYCDACAGKEPMNPCDLMKIDTTVVCTCTPKCNCDPCKLPPATNQRQPKIDHPDTCKCEICTCKQCDLPKKILEPLIVDHSDDCQCSTCQCNPCKLKADRNAPIDKLSHEPTCKCKLCCCNPCKLKVNDRCTQVYANLPDCVCTVCNCDPCKAKPKDCETCPECFGKGDCKCLHCMCVPCTKTRPEHCNCEQCRCTNCLPLPGAKTFIPNCNCLQCLCIQTKTKDTTKTVVCPTEDETKKCPVICPLNEMNRKSGRKKCSCSICYCNPCQPVLSDTKFEYTFKPPENNPLEATLKDNEQKNCTCEPCLCKTCPKKFDKKQCKCYICKCENCLFKQKNDENDNTCRCPRPCPCISCKGKGGAGSGNITTENIDHVRGGAATSNSEMQEADETDAETKCSCTAPCICQSCAGKKYQQDLKKCHCPTPCTCEHCPDTYNKAHLCTCPGTCTCRSCPAVQHEFLLKCNPKGECLCIDPCCCIECSGKKHLNTTDNNECTCNNICTCEKCISKSNERRNLLNKTQNDTQVPCDCEKPCICAVCAGNTGQNFVYPFGPPVQNQDSLNDIKPSEHDSKVEIQTSAKKNNIISTCQTIPNITRSICTTMLDNESHVTCDKLQDNEVYDETYVTLSNNDIRDTICNAIQHNKNQIEVNYFFDDETINIMITEAKSDKTKYEEDKPPCACTTPCDSTCLDSSHQTNNTTNAQVQSNECNLVKKLANQISSLITKPFQSSNHPSTVSTTINNLLNCDCPIPCLCPSKDQCGTYVFMNTPEKDTSTKRSHIMGASSSNKTQLQSEVKMETKKQCKCVGECSCSTAQIGLRLTQKQESDTFKYPNNKNSPNNTRMSDKIYSDMNDKNNFSSTYQSKRTCDCVGLCKCFNKQFGSNQKLQVPSIDITKRISANFKQLNDSSVKQQISKIILSKSQSTQFRIFETRKLTEDSLLIKWTPANMPCLTGYEIDVNGSLSHRVRNKDRCVAVLFNICFNKPVNISVFAMSKENRNHPPAIITVC